MDSSSPANVASSSLPASSSRLTVGWVLKRTLIAIVILTLSIGSSAWLLHAAIDPALEGREASDSLLTSISKAASRLSSQQP